MIRRLLAARAVVAPLVLLAEAALVALSPLLLAAAALAPDRLARFLALLADLPARHLAAAAALGRLRATGARADEAAHYAVLGRLVDGLFATAVRLARVRVRVHESADAQAALDARDRPLVVLSRHSGTGDSLLVLHTLVCRHGRRPRLVMHEALRLDPVVAALGDRLPNRFVDPRGGDTEVEVAALSRDLPADAAVVIFPEGGNVTEARRTRAAERLDERGHAEEAGWARELRHLMAPRPGGALAAVDAAPGADVVFVAHTGFPTSAGVLWRELPRVQTIDVRLWVVPAAEVPAGHDERIDWLFGWWRELDRWVDGRTPDP